MHGNFLDSTFPYYLDFSKTTWEIQNYVNNYYTLTDSRSTYLTDVSAVLLEDGS